MLATSLFILALAVALYAAVRVHRALARLDRGGEQFVPPGKGESRADPPRVTQPITTGTLTKRVEPDPEIVHSAELTARPKPRKLARFRLDSTIGREAYVIVDTQRDQEVCTASNFTDGQHATEALNFHYKWANLPEPFVSIARGTEVRQTLLQARALVATVMQGDLGLNDDARDVVNRLDIILDGSELLEKVS